MTAFLPSSGTRPGLQAGHTSRSSWHPGVSREAWMLGRQTVLLATTAESRPSAGTPLRQALQKTFPQLIMTPVWQMVQTGLLGTDSPLCSLPSHQAVCPGIASNLPSHGWQTGQMACGGKWLKNFALVRNSLLTFFLNWRFAQAERF